MRKLLGCFSLILLLVAPISYEYTGQRQVFDLFQNDRKVDAEIGLLTLLQRELVVYHAIGNIFQRSFTEPFETIMFLTWRGTVVGYTNHMAGQVSAPLELVNADLRLKGQDITDVILVVHNHFACSTFSPRDKKYYNHIKSKGFTGVFVLWDTARNKMVNRLPKK